MSPTTNRRQFLTRAGAATVTAAALPAVLGACSGGSDAGADGEQAADYEQGSAELTVELGEEVEGINYPEDYQGPRARTLEPFGDGSTTFSVLGRTIPGLAYDSNYYARLIEEKTGVKVEYQEVPLGDDGQTKVNAVLSSGDLPDALMTGMGLFSVSQVAVYGQQGMFIPLDQLIDEHAPHIRDMFETFPDMRTLYTAPDGKMYAVPSMNDCYHCKTGDIRTWINTNLLDSPDAAPETLDDFVAFLQKVKDAGDGVTPFIATVDHLQGTIAFFMGSFLPMSFDNLRLNSGKVEWIPADPKYREGMIWIQQQFRDGLFSTDMFSTATDQLTKLGDAEGGPKFAVTRGYSQTDFTAVADPTDEGTAANVMVPLAPLEGPDGARHSFWDWYQLGGPNFVISSSCEDPVTMIRWADYQYELTMTISMGRGEQGKGWDWSDKGEKSIDDRQAVYTPISNELENQSWWEWGPFYKSNDQRLGEGVAKDSPSVEPSLYQASKLYEPYQIPKEMKLPVLAFDMEQAAQVGETLTNLSTHLTQSVAAFAKGTADASDDADWKAFLDGFDKQGLQDYLKINQDAYDKQFG